MLISQNIMNNSEVQYQGKVYIINRHANESDEMLNERAWFIAKQNPSNDLDYMEAIKLSIIWQNMQYKKCRYHIVLENRVNEIQKLLYI
jgi:hypothetical protein